MTLSDMYADQSLRSFERRRDEVVSLVKEATDLHGADEVFQGIVELVSSASTESEFDDAFEVLEYLMSQIPLSIN
jgi:urease gamma subunit